MMGPTAVPTVRAPIMIPRGLIVSCVRMGCKFIDATILTHEFTPLAYRNQIADNKFNEHVYSSTSEALDCSASNKYSPVSRPAADSTPNKQEYNTGNHGPASAPYIG